MSGHGRSGSRFYAVLSALLLSLPAGGAGEMGQVDTGTGFLAGQRAYNRAIPVLLRLWADQRPFSRRVWRGCFVVEDFLLWYNVLDPMSGGKERQIQVHSGKCRG